MPNLTRRAFLSLLGSAAAVAALPLPEVLHFDPHVLRLPAAAAKGSLFSLRELTMALVKEIEGNLDVRTHSVFAGDPNEYHQLGTTVGLREPAEFGQVTVYPPVRPVILTTQFGFDAAFDEKKGLHESSIRMGGKMMANHFSHIAKKRDLLFGKLVIPHDVDGCVVVQSPLVTVRGVLCMDPGTWNRYVRFDSLVGPVV